MKNGAAFLHLNDCPVLEQVAEYLDGVLDPARHDCIERHLSGCTCCSKLLQETLALTRSVARRWDNLWLDALRSEGVD